MCMEGKLASQHHCCDTSCKKHGREISLIEKEHYIRHGCGLIVNSTCDGIRSHWPPLFWPLSLSFSVSLFLPASVSPPPPPPLSLPVPSLLFRSPDGLCLLSCSNDNKLRLFNLPPEANTPEENTTGLATEPQSMVCVNVAKGHIETCVHT